MLFTKYVLDALFKSAIVIPFPLLIELRKLYFKIYPRLLGIPADA